VFYIYVHCRPDGEPFYVGKGRGNRARQFKVSRNSHYKNIVAKYGSENIEVSIIPCKSEAAAFTQEIQLIKAFRDLGYELANHSDGGEGPTGATRSKATRDKVSAARKGIKFSAEHCANISAAKRGKATWNKGKTGEPLSTQCRSKISLALKGRAKGARSAEHCARIAASRTGKKYPRVAK
jgi:hypothetical protein